MQPHVAQRKWQARDLAIATGIVWGLASHSGRSGLNCRVEQCGMDPIVRGIRLLGGGKRGLDEQLVATTPHGARSNKGGSVVEAERGHLLVEVIDVDRQRTLRRPLVGKRCRALLQLLPLPPRRLRAGQYSTGMPCPYASASNAGRGSRSRVDPHRSSARLRGRLDGYLQLHAALLLGEHERRLHDELLHSGATNPSSHLQGNLNEGR